MWIYIDKVTRSPRYAVTCDAMNNDKNVMISRPPAGADSQVAPPLRGQKYEGKNKNKREEVGGKGNPHS